MPLHDFSGSGGVATLAEPTAEQFQAIREQLAALQEQLVSLQQQVNDLRSLITSLVKQWPGGRQTVSPPPQTTPPATKDVLAACGRDVVLVLREAGGPLTLSEILDSLVHRHLSWRENTVRHALDELKDDRVVEDASSRRPYSYGLCPDGSHTGPRR